MYLDQKISSTRGKWKEFLKLDLAKFGGDLIFKCNLNKTDCYKRIPVNNLFIRELLETWSEVNFVDVIENEKHQGHPTDRFGGISVRKTCNRLKFSVREMSS